MHLNAKTNPLPLLRLWQVKKTLMVMKLTVVLFLAACLQANATGFAQTFTLSLKEVPIEKAFKAIQKESGYHFFYNERLLKSCKKVTLQVSNASLQTVLDICFKDQPVAYEIDGKQIVVKVKEPEAEQETVVVPSAPPPVEVSGKIVDAEGRPLAGASVKLKGTDKGATADANGNFTLEVPDTGGTLVISFIGHQSVEVPVLKGGVLKTITLQSDESKMEDVVVVGYGSQKKSDLTGSVSSVKGEDLIKLPTQRVDQALQGRAAGVLVQNTDGSPGGRATIRVRGGNSITGGNNALVVVDGVQGVNISTINPNDVESLEVLKDASATAIYGARGANGVILITTKKGVPGKPVFHYGLSAGWQQLNNKLDLMNAGDFARKANDWAATQNGTEASPITPVLPFTEEQIKALSVNGGTDWQDEIYHNGALQNHQLSISGGSDNIRYFVSGGYMNQQGIVVNTQYKRYSLRSNLDLKLTNFFFYFINLNAIKDK